MQQRIGIARDNRQFVNAVLLLQGNFVDNFSYSLS